MGRGPGAQGNGLGAQGQPAEHPRLVGTNTQRGQTAKWGEEGGIIEGILPKGARTRVGLSPQAHRHAEQG